MRKMVNLRSVDKISKKKALYFISLWNKINKLCKHFNSSISAIDLT
jgi:hypothetical protein